VNSTKRTKTYKTIGKIFVIMSAIITPIFICLYVISINEGGLIDSRFAGMLPGLIFWLVFFFCIGIFIINKNKEKNSSKKKTSVSMFLLSGYVMELAGLMMLLYGTNSNFKNWLINTAMETFNYQHVATSLYSDKEIREIINKDKAEETTDYELVTFDELDFNKERYANKYEEEILKKDYEGQLHKIIKIKGNTKYGNYKYEGYLAVIYDPSKVSLAPSKGAGLHPGSYGQTIDTIGRETNALVAINAGGWYDPLWISNGGIPHGIVISNGEFKSEYTRAVDGGGIIGFDDKDRLVLKYMSKEEAIASGIRDCVDFGPFLVVNGQNRYEGRSGGWAYAPRTGIGQRKDGIVLFLVIDGRQAHSVGVDVNDMADIFMQYGAYNAANLDGGTSSAMYADGEITNIPHSGYGRLVRQLPNAWIATE